MRSAECGARWRWRMRGGAAGATCYVGGVAKESAGLLPYRIAPGHGLQVFLVHPGGPFWRNKDAGAWTIAKGEVVSGETPLAAARREFEEETGLRLDGPFETLGMARQAGGKLVHCFATAAEIDAAAVQSNTFVLEWPPRSGRQVSFPEIDQAAWFAPQQAAQKMNPAQVTFLERLRVMLDSRGRADSPGIR